MRIEWQIGPLQEWKSDALLFFSFEESPGPPPGVKKWLQEHPSWAPQLSPLRDFQGKPQQTAVYYGDPAQPVPRVLCVGLGLLESFDPDILRNAMAALLRKCRDLRLSAPGLPLMAFEGVPIETAVAFREALIGGLCGLYRYDALKTRNEATAAFPETLRVFDEAEPTAALLEVVQDARDMASGIFLARDLVTSPANQATPAFLAETALDLAKEHDFSMQVLDLEDARKMGMGLFVAVSQGSHEPARLIILEHAPAGTENDQPLVFIGKGITFDTGGISIKPSNKMEAMKHDMAGAAAVLGALKVIGATALKRRIVAILPCCENMPDGKAYKPGDVLRSLSGLTVEVISTDAEGRLILGDALTYALRYKPFAVVDLATLTGACIVALGDRVGAVMGNRQPLIDQVQEIGMKVGERLWPLPLWDFYFDDLKSDVADFKNVGERKGGAIVGGIFLKQFVPDEVPWVHLDIAGPAWSEKDLLSVPKGATGFGVRLLVELARQWK